MVDVEFYAELWDTTGKQTAVRREIPAKLNDFDDLILINDISIEDHPLLHDNINI